MSMHISLPERLRDYLGRRQNIGRRQKRLCSFRSVAPLAERIRNANIFASKAIAALPVVLVLGATINYGFSAIKAYSASRVFHKQAYSLQQMFKYRVGHYPTTQEENRSVISQIPPEVRLSFKQTSYAKQNNLAFLMLTMLMYLWSKGTETFVQSLGRLIDAAKTFFSKRFGLKMAYPLETNRYGLLSKAEDIAKVTCAMAGTLIVFLIGLSRIGLFQPILSGAGGEVLITTFYLAGLVWGVSAFLDKLKKRSYLKTGIRNDSQQTACVGKAESFIQSGPAAPMEQEINQKT